MTDETDAPVVEETAVEAEAETEELGNEEQAEQEQPSDSSPEKSEPKGVQKRIDELTRNWRETERDRDYWRELAVRNQKPEEVQPKQPEQPVKTLADFEYDEGQYHAYLFDRAKDEAIKAVREESTRESTIRKQSEFKKKEESFAKNLEDYNDVTRNPSLKITQEMVDILQDADEGPAVLYHLGKNPDIADILSDLPPVALARELGKIEAKISLSKPEKASTKAPPPPPKIQAVEPSVNVSPTSPESDNISTDEWLKRRNKQLAKG